ncbi:MAG: glutamate synthase subunit beta [Cryomorphaceae bacterium]
MGKDTGFLEVNRQGPAMRQPEERVKDYKEHYLPLGERANEQASRCMDCGVPFCNSGCPLGNRIPEFNDAVYRGDYKEAYSVLRTTNNFPEFTGRICPAPCEAACVLGINNNPVTIEFIEKEISEKAWEEGWVVPKLPVVRTGKSVAVVGAGPAGLAAADQLNQKGHRVKVFERDARVGGLLTYGIPDYKLEKHVVARRAAIMEEEGVVFQCNTEIGTDITLEELRESFDAVLITIGSKQPRDIRAKGREAKGVHFAMDFLHLNNQKVAGDAPVGQDITAKDKTVLVIGGGDTGSDCIGTSIRQGAKEVIQVTIEEQPPLERAESNPWPEWPKIMRTSSSHEEGCERIWGLNATSFNADQQGNLVSVSFDEVRGEELAGRWQFVPTGTKRTIECDMAVLAIGFVHPEHEGLVSGAGLSTDPRGNIAAEGFKTSMEGVFTAGDARRGQSLVVWAIAEGRQAADAIDVSLAES